MGSISLWAMLRIQMYPQSSDAHGTHTHTERLWTHLSVSGHLLRTKHFPFFSNFSILLLCSNLSLPPWFHNLHKTIGVPIHVQIRMGRIPLKAMLRTQMYPQSSDVYGTHTHRPIVNESLCIWTLCTKNFPFFSNFYLSTTFRPFITLVS